MEIDKDDKAKKEMPHISGAYIHSLVKHLTSTNNPINGDGVQNENDNNTHQQRPHQPKKQVRRRHHTSKPYQERLLNMAEARKEIATALKFHRASMKQQEASGNHELQSHPPPEQERKSSSGRNLRRHPTAATNNYLGLYSGLSFPPPPPPPLHHEDLNLALPNQTLGLNLNFQDFDNLNTRIYSLSSPSSSPLSSSPAVVVASSSGGVAGDRVVGGLVDEIRLLGEQQPLKSIEEDGNSGSHGDDEYHPFEQVMEFPPWLNETSCFQDLFDHQFSDEYSPDPALPCMDIGEIEGMDGEWLA